MYQIYTIGHSNNSKEQFVNLLTNSQIQALIDVRSNPHSEWASYANKENINKILKPAGIIYLYLGDVLGGRPSDPDCYDIDKQKANYKIIRKKPYFKEGINRILKGLNKYRICIMCTEENPSFCHRNMLVAEALRQKGIRILHIRSDGRVQTDEELWKEKIGVPVNQLELLK